MYYFFLAIVVIGYETTATARWALLFIVRAFFNDTITVAVWTGFHVRLMRTLPYPRDYIRWCFVDPAVAAAFAKLLAPQNYRLGRFSLMSDFIAPLPFQPSPFSSSKAKQLD